MHIPVWNFWAFLIVIIGSIFLLFISFGSQEAVRVLRSFFDFSSNHIDENDAKMTLTKLAEAYRDYDFKKWDQFTIDSFTDRCKEIVKDGVLNSDSRKLTFTTKLEEAYNQNVEQAVRMRHFGYYPVALGFISLIVSCFVLSWCFIEALPLPKADAFIKFGFLSIIYGLVVSYCLIYPLARRHFENAKRGRHLHQIVIHALLLIGNRASPIQVSEEIAVYSNAESYEDLAS